MVKTRIKIIRSILLLCSFISCKNEKSAKPIIQNQKTTDSILKIKERDTEYKKTTDNNQEILKSIVFENITYDKENDFTNIKSVLLETPVKIRFSSRRMIKSRKEISAYSFDLLTYMEYKEPYKLYLPFINESNKKIEFILSYGESGEIPVKISFKKGQVFWFGKKYKWLTPKIKLNVNDSTDYQDYDKNSFKKDMYQKSIHDGTIIEFKNKKYLLFFISDGMWWIHHLFDITDEQNIKYYILNSIYGLEDCYGDFNNDGKLDFKQKYAYLKNSVDKSQDKYKTYTLPQ